MAKHSPTPETPACYAMTLPGLETLAGQEIVEDLRGEVKRSQPGIVVFRVPEVNPRLLRLRTTEDIFLLAWGTDKLTYRTQDLDRIRRWTAHDADWENLLRLHHAIRPKPRGKPTYRLVAQMTGEHGYRRIDALEALAKGLAGKLPASWRPAEENASVEVWLTIHGATAICGLRLSDRSMRHRTYKEEHQRASLRPTLAAAMVRVARAGPGQVMVDPMCGVGTILAEQLAVAGRSPIGRVEVFGGDIEAAAVRAAASNLRHLGEPLLVRWDARRLPLPGQSVDRVVSNPPFGRQLSRPEEVGPLYQAMVQEYDRALRPGGRAVLLVSDLPALRDAARAVGWQREDLYRVRVLGQPAAVTVWRKAK